LRQAMLALAAATVLPSSRPYWAGSVEAVALVERYLERDKVVPPVLGGLR